MILVEQFEHERTKENEGGIQLELVNCSKCGRLYLKNSIRDICDECYREEEEEFERVRKFLNKRENRTASLLQVVEGTGVEEKKILKWIRSGRLRIVNFPNLQYPCENCGRPIRTGRLCERCQKGLKHDLELFERERKRRRKKVDTYYAYETESSDK